ncbi:Asp23/Gls24 family envelope stress response protein [Oscillospiraceae bacterium OttesenSCG-928-G22]|nr:Asp23/Gls24 family envelope stress response protein [Oscillospiraceae bacterium OttesenSCG-928-G22]
MSDNRDYVETNEENGVISISEEVIASIASIAVLEVDGVLSIIPAGGLDISDLLWKAPTRGIKISFDEASVRVDVALSVRYGARLTDVASRVQDEVSSAIESMAGLTVSAVNVRIGSIVLPASEPEGEAESSVPDPEEPEREEE